MAEDLSLEGVDSFSNDCGSCNDSSLLFFFLILVALFNDSGCFCDRTDDSLLFFFLLLVILLGGGSWF